LSYLAITDHSQSLTVAHGLNEDRLLRQVDEIDALNETLAGFTILRGIEVDILDHGRLDLPDRVLERLDLVVGSVHSGFNLSREAQTERILRAMDNRFFTILAHPTGRRLPTRGPYPVDLERIIDHARQRGCFLECNANPRRLDLDDIHCRKAKEAGVLISIATDSHRAAGFRNLEFGLMQARRGWLAKEDVLNTRRIEDLRPLLRRTMRA
jgi:DNA polymerase (family 10)